MALVAVVGALSPHEPYDNYDNACDDTHDGNACGERTGPGYEYEEAAALAAAVATELFLS
jgi:hypothetical protein